MDSIRGKIERWDSGTPSMPNGLRGFTSALTLGMTPFGAWMLPKLKFTSEERLEKGYVLVLPGIEGHSVLNRSVVCGLIDAGLPYAVEIVDWTGGYRLGPVNLRWKSRNLRTAAAIAQRICDYQDEFPGRPVHLVGHSGGGGMSMLTLEALPEYRNVETVTMLAPALSPKFDLRTALQKVNREVRHFYSSFDFLLLGVGTLAVGTLDGRHRISAGMCGFQWPKDISEETRNLYEIRLNQIPYSARMAKSWNFGGHFGCTNRKFTAEWVAPFIAGTETESKEILDIETQKTQAALETASAT